MSSRTIALYICRDIFYGSSAKAAEQGGYETKMVIWGFTKIENSSLKLYLKGVVIHMTKVSVLSSTDPGGSLTKLTFHVSLTFKCLISTITLLYSNREHFEIFEINIFIDVHTTL